MEIAPIMSASNVTMLNAPMHSWYAPHELSKLETPCYVFDPARVIADYSKLKRELGTPLVVSLKANPNPDLFVRCAQTFVDGIELASMGELNVVVGRSPIPKFINTPAMDLPLMAAAIASRATLVLDSLEQVEMLATIRSKVAPLPVVLRLNAKELVGDASALAAVDHFGCDLPGAMAAITRLRALGIGVRGLHVFAGSYSFKTWSPIIRAAAERILPEIRQRQGSDIEFVNVGGGFPDDWDSQRGLFDAYRGSLAALSSKTRVYHEAGRAIFAGSGSFVTKVIAIKSIGGRRIAICDGGITNCFMLSQTEKVIKRFQKPDVIAMQEQSETAHATPRHGAVQVVGNSCNRMDVIGELGTETKLAQGDRLVFRGCGAYSTYSPVGFLSLKAARRYLIS
jgi:diaminopimelate decarboxylase